MKDIELTEELQSSLDEHSNRIKVLITRKAGELAAQEYHEEGEKPQITVLHLAKAIEAYSPGRELSQSVNAQKDAGRFYDRLPPITIISAILAIAFGVIGVVAIKYGQQTGIDGKGFIDIAKIFAGAIVGSATTVAVSRKTKDHG